MNKNYFGKAGLYGTILLKWTNENEYEIRAPAGCKNRGQDFVKTVLKIQDSITSRQLHEQLSDYKLFKKASAARGTC